MGRWVCRWGAWQAATPKDAAEKYGSIHIGLSTSPRIKAALRAVDGSLAGPCPGLIVKETSAADPGPTPALAAELAAKAGASKDAPPGRTPFSTKPLVHC